MTKEEVYFNEDFGLGATYPSGEENIFLYRMSRSNYLISYVPKVIVNHLKPTLQSRLNYQMFISKGPLLKTIYNTPIGIVLLSGLFLKKAKHLDQPLLFYRDALKELYSYKREKEM